MIKFDVFKHIRSQSNFANDVLEGMQNILVPGMLSSLLFNRPYLVPL